MSKTEPIQGPLIVKRGWGTVPHYVIVDRDSGVGIAHVFDFDTENARTSALLFAAAPDLLEACKAVLRCLNMGTAHEMCKRNLELAIAKAESETDHDS